MKSMMRWAAIAMAAGLLAGCAGTPQHYSVAEVYLCAAEECGVAGHKYSTAQVLDALQQLLKANEGRKVDFCESDPKTRTCESVGLCHFVQGGPIPGLGCGLTVAFSQISRDSKGGHLKVTTDFTQTFIGLPVICTSTAGTIAVRSATEITFDIEPHMCNWMGLGNMTSTFNLVIESIDLDRGQVGGYWNHGVAGTGGGSGSGYGVMRFPKGMPRGENWIAERL